MDARYARLVRVATQQMLRGLARPRRRIDDKLLELYEFYGSPLFEMLLILGLTEIEIADMCGAVVLGTVDVRELCEQAKIVVRVPHMRRLTYRGAAWLGRLQTTL